MTRLGRNYRVIPDSHAETRLKVATGNGILADKLIAFPERLPVFVRWRDIWDVHWLVERGVSVDASLVRAKLDGYGIRNFDGRLAEAARQLPGLLASEEMEARLEDFVPKEVAVRTLCNLSWRQRVATEFRNLLEKLRRDLTVGPDNRTDGAWRDPFEIPDPFELPSPWDN